MVDSDEILWQQRVHGEAAFSRMLQEMRNSKENAEYKVKCVRFMDSFKEAIKEFPNDQDFGAHVKKLYSSYFN